MIDEKRGSIGETLFLLKLRTKGSEMSDQQKHPQTEQQTHHDHNDNTKDAPVTRSKKYSKILFLAL